MLRQIAQRSRVAPPRPAARLSHRSAALLTCAGILGLLAGPVAGAQAATFSFKSATTLTPGGTPAGVAIADVNGDGRPDLIVTDNSTSNVDVFLGKGDGTFPSTPSATYPTSNPGQIAVADLNGDGKPDLVVTDATGVAVLLNSGTGTFPVSTQYDDASDVAATGVAIGDLNKDGKPDIAVTDGNEVSVLLNAGAGAFGSAVGYSVGADTPSAVTLGDFNHDGKLDVATANETDGNVSILTGNGDGTLASSTDYPTGSGPVSIVAGDFNGDGKVDLATADSGAGGAASVLLNSGTGTFPTHVEYTTGAAPAAIAVGDFNSDGKLDLVTANGTPGTASVLLGKGDGTFAAKQDFGTAAGPDAVAAADLNGDGEPDIVTTGATGANTVSVLVNGSTPTSDVTGSISDFGSVLYGTKSAAQKVTLTNNGSAILRISSVTVSGNFTASGVTSGATLAPGAKLTLSVVFAPKGYGALTGSVTIATNASSPKLTLSGTGIPAAPLAWTNDVSDVEFSYATLNGTVNSQGPGTFYFEYGPTTAYGTNTPVVPTASSALNQLFATTIPVAPGAQYHYQLVVTNNVKTVYGGDQVFNTQPDPPVIGSGVGKAGLARVLKDGIPVLLRLDSAGAITVEVYIPVSVAVARHLIKHARKGVKRVFLGSEIVAVNANQTTFATVSIGHRAQRLLRGLSSLSVTVTGTAQANKVVGDPTSKTIVLKHGA